MKVSRTVVLSSENLIFNQRSFSIRCPFARRVICAFHLCPFGNSYLTARAPKIGPKSNINHLDAPIKLSWGMMLVGKD